MSAILMVGFGVGAPITQAAAQAPANDLLANATVVGPGPFSETLDTTGATTDADDVQANSKCQVPAPSNSVWYSYTTTADTVLVVDTLGTDYQTNVVTAIGSPGSLDPVSCTAGNVRDTYVTTGLGPGITVSIAIFGSGGTGGNLAVSIYAAEVPANDTIGAAITIPSLPFSDLRDTTVATADADDAQVGSTSTCGPDIRASVWYRFTAGPNDTSVLFDATRSTYSPGIIVATGSPGALTTVACGFQVVVAPTSPGTTYHVLVYTGFSRGGRLLLNVSPTPPAPSIHVTFGDKGHVDRLGVAHLAGTYKCTSAPDAAISGQVTQTELSRARTGHFAFAPEEGLNCDGRRHRFEVTVLEEEHENGGHFAPGKLKLDYQARACNLAGCAFLPPASQVVKLAGQDPRCFGKRATIAGWGSITGTRGDDVIVGSAANDDIDGRGGDDLICALAGNDGLSGGRGDDKIDGGEGDDRMRGDVTNRDEGGGAVGGGDDWLFGGPGDDIMDGDSANFVGPASGGGDDHLFGGDGDDSLTGDSVAFAGDARGAGDDVLDGGAGVEFLIGDSEAFEGDAIGNGGDDVLDLGADGGFIAIGDHNISAPAPAGGRARGAGDDDITGGSADDLLIGDSSSAGPVTRAGDDEIEGRGGNDTLFGDNVNFDADQTFGTVGGEDELEGDAGADTLRAGPDDDELDGGKDTDDCDGEAGTDDDAKRCETLAGVP